MKSLKKWRKEANLTQEQAALKLGVSHDSIARWESGVTQPTALQIVDICRVYKCKFDEIIWPKV